MKGQWCCATTAVQQLWTGATSTTCWELSKSPKIWHSVNIWPASSYIRRKDEKLLSSLDIVILSSHNNSFSIIFRCNTWFIHLFQCLVNYTMALELDYSPHSRRIQTSNIACNMPSSKVIQEDKISIPCSTNAMPRFSKMSITSSCMVQSRASEVAEDMTWI